MTNILAHTRVDHLQDEFEGIRRRLRTLKESGVDVGAFEGLLTQEGYKAYFKSLRDQCEEHNATSH